MADGKVVIDIDGNDSGLKNTLKSVGKVAGAALKGVAVGIGGVTTALGAMGKASLDGFADFEQLIGGVDTLFKESSQTVQTYADNAFRTAGLSANAYMETVTSFSASLLQSLGGDTAKAADMADLAITDMSDNANKMGTDMRDIQNAYQGFAKQNYTMLDNLKLGYGGTKEEMQRLLADAEKLSGQKFDLSSYADIVQAIHVVQTEMGITGTTAQEAASTIDGSINTMKAAWSNLLVGFADENADMDTLIQNLVDSVAAVGQNVLPRLQQIFGAFAQYAPQLLDEAGALVQTFAQGILNALPGLTTTAGTLVLSLGQGLISNLPQLLQIGAQVVQTIGANVLAAAPGMVTTAAELLGMLASGIAASLPQLIPAALSMLTQISGGLRDGAGQLIDGALAVVTAIGEGIISSLPSLIESVPEIVTNIAGIINDNAPKLVTTAAELLGKLAMGLIQAIPTLVANIPQIIQAIVAVFTAFNWIHLGKTVITMLKNGVVSMASAAKSAGGKILDAVRDGLKSLPSKLLNLGKNGIQGLINGAKSLFSSAGSTMKSLGTRIVNKVKNLPERLKQVGKDLVQGLINGISEKIDALKKKAGEIANTVTDKITGLFKTHSPSRVMIQIGKYVGQGLAIGMEATKKLVGKTAAGVASAVTKEVSRLNDEIEQITEKQQARQAAEELASYQKSIKDKYAELAKTEASGKQKVLDEIASLQADWNKKQLEAQENAEKEKLQAQLKTVQDFQTEYENALKTVENAQTSMEDKLKGYGDLFTRTKEGVREIFSLGDLEKDIDAITRYGDALEKLKARGVSSSLLDEIAGMDVSDATQYAERLLSMADSQYDQYMARWEQKQQAAAKVAQQFYQTELDAVHAEFAEKIPEELSDVKDEMHNIGANSVQGMVEGMYSKSGVLSAAAGEIVRRAIAAMREAADIHSPSKQTAKLVGAPLAQGVGAGFDRVYPQIVARMRSAFDSTMERTSARLHAAAAVPHSTTTHEITNNTTTIDRILRLEVGGEDGEFVRWLRKKIKSEDDRVGPVLA